MAELLSDGTKKISLSREQYQGISKVLQGFYRQTKCGVVMLSDTSGLALAQSGRLDSHKMMLLSSVAAGNYSATREMARLIGEDEGFKVQFHEGEENNIYVSGIDDNFFLVVVFGKTTTFGMIRVLVSKTITELDEILKTVDADVDDPSRVSAQEQVGDPEFKDELTSRLDAMFGTK